MLLSKTSSNNNSKNNNSSEHECCIRKNSGKIEETELKIIEKKEICRKDQSTKQLKRKTCFSTEDKSRNTRHTSITSCFSENTLATLNQDSSSKLSKLSTFEASLLEFKPRRLSFEIYSKYWLWRFAPKG